MAKNFVKLSPNEISIDPTYQRSLDESRVASIAKTLDLSRVGVPVLSLRADGTYVVLDGQHRLEAMRRAGIGGTKILCEVHNGLTPPEEAELFLKLNNGRKSVDTYNKYRARLVAKEPVAVEFTRIAASLGIRIGQAQGKNTVCAILAVESAHRRNRNLETTLMVLKKWGHGEAAAFDGELIKDISRFLVDHSPDVDVNEFIAKLSRIDPGYTLRKIKAIADTTKDRRLAANSVFREIYNHRRNKKDKLLPVEIGAVKKNAA